MSRRGVRVLSAPLLAVALLASACTSGRSPTTPTTGGTPPSASPGAEALLAVVTPSSSGEQGAVQFEAWLGSPVGIIGDYTDNSSWTAMAASFQIANLERWVAAHPSGQVELSIGMLPEDRYVAPRDATAAQDQERMEAMAQGAAGAFDEQWRRLGELLVGDQLGHAILRPGWEAGGNYFPWSAEGAESAYAAYFQRIVTVMRSVPGSDFRFDWSTEPGRTSDGRSPRAAYPGPGYVDYIGLDVYDQSGSLYPEQGPISASRQASVWRQINDGPYGLQWFVRFARSQAKPLLVGEWGLFQQGPNHGGGDDPGFIRSMHDFLYRPANNVYAGLYFNEDPGGASAGRSSAVFVPAWGPDTNYLFPRAAATFRSLFGR